MSQVRRLLLLLVLLAAVACAVVVWWRTTPIDPTGPAPELGTTPVLPVPVPDGTATQPPDGTAQEIVLAFRCFDREVRTGGWMDLCWQLARVPDLDPAADYYRLSVYGTLSGNAWPADARHAFVRITPTADTAPTYILDASPTVRSPQETAVDSGWVGDVLGDGAYAAVWNSAGILVGMTGTHGVGLYVIERVPEGSRPAWTINAELSW